MEVLGFVGNLSPARKIPIPELAEALDGMDSRMLVLGFEGDLSPARKVTIPELSDALAGGDSLIGVLGFVGNLSPAKKITVPELADALADISASDPNVIPWDDDEMHPDAVEGDCFDDFANLAAWAATLPARFPGSVVYSTGGSIDDTTSPYNGKKTYNLAADDYLQLRKDMGIAYPVISMRGRFASPIGSVFGGGLMARLGWQDRAEAELYAAAQATYNQATEVWDTEYSIGSSPNVAQSLASIDDGAYHVWLMEARNVGGATLPQVKFWFDGVAKYDRAMDESYLAGPLPNPNTGIQVCDMYIATANPGSSCAMWEIVPGAATDLYSGLTG